MQILQYKISDFAQCEVLKVLSRNEFNFTYPLYKTKANDLACSKTKLTD